MSPRTGRFHVLLVSLPALAILGIALETRGAQPSPERRNVVLVLSDDHRYDFMGFMPQAPDFLETPAMDRMARQGAHLAHAFVTTSLCSPSRASILTGQYMHHHHVVDNQRPVPPGTTFFPQSLQEAGYATAFIGKWHGTPKNSRVSRGFLRSSSSGAILMTP